MCFVSAWEATAALLSLALAAGFQTVLEALAAGSHDKDTLMAARIAELLFPAGQHQSQDEAYSAYIARIKLMYHKQVLVPLRACLDVPEVTCSYTHSCKSVAAALSICKTACLFSCCNSIDSFSLSFVCMSVTTLHIFFVDLARKSIPSHGPQMWQVCTVVSQAKCCQLYEEIRCTVADLLCTKDGEMLPMRAGLYVCQCLERSQIPKST